jgi:adenylylsulfate kinase-like enzyme
VYSKARARIIVEFAGVSAPYDPPSAPAMKIDNDSLTPGGSAHMALTSLKPGLGDAQ